ncbi:putative nuclease HARBI1 [Mytilus trossulus]|uniref:putative nuclease HARBI1 n=1 Tax=Mytilus trossulus TaxID=6551 RepID=UPI00300766EA
MRRERVFIDRTNPLDLYDDLELVERFRFDRQTILQITDLLQEDLESSTLRNHAIPPVMKVFIALRFYASGSFQNIIADTFNIDQATVSRTIHSVSNALVRRAPKFIKFPSGQVIEENKVKFYAVANFPNVLGLIDGTHVRIIAPSQHEEQFVNRKCYHSINVQVIVNSDSQFINIVAKWPGSSHDSRVLKESRVFMQLEQSNHGAYLLGDSGYPCKKFLLTPYLYPQTRQEIRFNRSHKVTRCAVERTIGQWKRRFHCLYSEIRLSPATTCKVIISCGVLHNIAKKNNIPLNGDDLDDVLDDDMEEVENGMGRNGFHIRKSVTELHF